MQIEGSWVQWPTVATPTPETKLEVCRVQAQPGLCRESLSQKNRKKEERMKGRRKKEGRKEEKEERKEGKK
jgi:hypothetical protein